MKQYLFQAISVRGLMKIKGLKRKNFIDAGFQASLVDEWLYRRQKRQQPSASDTARIAQWLEVPMEYILGAPSEYDGADFWEVAARSSLETFLRRTPDGKAVGHLRPVFEHYLLTHKEKAPMTVEHWRRAQDLVMIARSHQADETANLSRMLHAESPLPRAADETVISAQPPHGN